MRVRVVGRVDLETLRCEAVGVVGREVSLSVGRVGSFDAYAVALGDGDRLLRRVCSFERIRDVVVELAQELRAPGPRYAKDGLASDYWWKDVSFETAKKARDWVRWRLLADPTQSDAAMDRFIASLDPPKREDLIRRAVEGRSPLGF
jgi:hypothetical protein